MDWILLIGLLGYVLFRAFKRSKEAAPHWAGVTTPASNAASAYWAPESSDEPDADDDESPARGEVHDHDDSYEQQGESEEEFLARERYDEPGDYTADIDYVDRSRDD